MIRSFVLSAAFALSAAGAGAAFAQQAPGMDDAVAAAKNQLGVLEYCQAEGHIDDKAVKVQTRLFAQMPAAGDAAKTDAAYEKGQSGVISSMGIEQSLADAAKAQGAEVAILCRQMASLVEQAGG